MITISENSNIETIETIVLKNVHAQIIVDYNTLSCDRLPIANAIHDALSTLCSSELSYTDDDEDDEYTAIWYTVTLNRINGCCTKEVNYFFELLNKEEGSVDTVLLLKKRTYTASWK